MKDTGLAMQCSSKLELVSYTSRSCFFLSLCEDVEVAIEGLKTRHSIFIIEYGDYNLVLGQPLLNLVKFS